MLDNIINDRIVLDRFYDLISWQDQCEEVEFNARILLKTPHSLELVAHCSTGILKNCLGSRYCLDFLYSKSNLKPGLIIWGKPDKRLVDAYMTFSCQHGVHVSFVDVQARLAYSRFLTKALDGIDWQRSLEGLAKGDKKPVWSWDK